MVAEKWRWRLQAFAPNVVPYHRIEERARMWRNHLLTALEMTDAKGLHLIAHSMGGLDARYVIAELNGASYIRSLTTISTPHHGTYLAQYSLDQPSLVRDITVSFMDRMGEMAYPHAASDALSALQELTPAFLNDTFNPSIPNHPDVLYQSYSARAGAGTPVPIFPTMLLSNAILHRAEGANDGIVSEKSGRWGNHLGVLDADHARQIGIANRENGFQANRFMADLVTDLATKTF